MSHSDRASLLHVVFWIALIVGIVGVMGRLYTVFALWQAHREPKMLRNAIFTILLNLVLIAIGLAGLEGWISF